MSKNKEHHPFTNIELIHDGNAFCQVFKAQRYNQWWALKTVKPEYAHDATCKNALYKEYKIGSQLDVFSIVRYVSWEWVPELGSCCIVMEYVDGVTLEEFMKEQRVDLRLGHKISREIIVALMCCLGQQVVHRDLKPSNIMITRNGHNVKLIDFGLSDRDDISFLKIPAGNRKYMAPEQGVKGARVDFRADMYALGKIMREFNVPKRFNRIFDRCTDPDPEKRYPSYFALIDDLLRTLNRYRLQRHTIISLIVIPVMVIAAFVLGYGAMGGYVLGFGGKKQAYKGIPDAYYERDDKYANDERCVSFFMPKYNCDIYYLHHDAEIPGNISEGKAVDLGLSVKWAPFNFGCDHESLIMLGALVGYGDTTGHQIVPDAELYQHTNIKPENDIVRKVWGGNWRMPTYEEFRELLNKCQWRVIIENGHQPCFVVTGPNGKSIVMAGTGVRYRAKHLGAIVSGNYWTSNVGRRVDENRAICLTFTRDNFKFLEAEICYGLAIRPVLPYTDQERATHSDRIKSEIFH
ncbi:MAG: serine/threonine-protein kinase [Bacteroidales bacterium]|nr:serine/threonine-protein kinase [Bacteroidales bacterium]